MARLWGTEFAVPATVTALAAVVDEETSWVSLSWAWSGSDDLLDAWHVYRQDGAGDLVRVDDDRATDPDDPTFVDFDAPWGVALIYFVSAYDGAREGEAATIATEIFGLGMPFLVVPGDGATSWSPTMLPGGRRLPRTSKTIAYALERSTAIATSGTIRRPAGSATFSIEWADIEQLEQFRTLEDYANANEYVVAKLVAGETLRVQVDNLVENGPNADGWSVSFDWYAVR
jgi:hypothetical protein